MKTLFTTVMILILLCGAVPLLAQQVGADEVVIDGKTVKVRGEWAFQRKDISINGQVLHWYAERATLGTEHYATIDVTGYDRFVAMVGIPDTFRGEVDQVTVEVDGDLVFNQRVRSGQKPCLVNVSVTGMEKIIVGWHDRAIIGEPKLAKGGVPVKPPVQPATTPPIPAPKPAVEQPAPVTQTFDGLALALRKRIDARPEVKTVVDKGRLAVLPFQLVGIADDTVAVNVAEDLTTSLINNNFNIIERSLLSKLLQGLKITDSSQIDAAAAQKINIELGCDYLLVGSISSRGDVVVINARFLDLPACSSLAAERMELPKKAVYGKK
ncbi:MAG: CsgG/HfaB family protein [Armatimonadota bacterium]